MYDAPILINQPYKRRKEAVGGAFFSSWLLLGRSFRRSLDPTGVIVRAGNTSVRDTGSVVHQ